MADARALTWAKRIGAQFALHATSLDLVRAGDTSHRRGMFVVGTVSVAGSFYDANEEVGLQKPALSVYVEGVGGAYPTDPPRVNDVFNRDDRLWTVRKVWQYRHGDSVVLVLCLCD